jgi:predicted nucleic acid-binding Zn ribbon protein
MEVEMAHQAKRKSPTYGGKKKICAYEFCSNSFEIKIHTQRFCSERCMRERGRRKKGIPVYNVRRCKNIDCEMWFKSKRKGKSQLFCSAKCSRRQSHRNRNNKLGKPTNTPLSKCTRRCVICGSYYTPKMHKQKTCSFNCSELNRYKNYEKYNQQLIEAGHIPLHLRKNDCIICGFPFTPTTPTHKTCSQGCSKVLRKITLARHSKRKKEILRRRGEAPDKICVICGKIFRDIGKISTVSTCSEICSAKKYIKDNNLMGEAGDYEPSYNINGQKKWKQKKCKKRCAFCGTEFISQIHGRKKYCSKACGKKRHSQISINRDMQYVALADDYVELFGIDKKLSREERIAYGKAIADASEEMGMPEIKNEIKKVDF